MTDKQYQKIVADARRDAGRKYGFRQNTYINFKVEQGYFFCVYFQSDEARLTVKPMYADDLWWDIWDASENKGRPVSLRGTGAFSLSGQVLASYVLPETTDKEELAVAFEGVFSDAAAAISGFLTENPDADAFYPDEQKMDLDPDRLLYLMALIHNGREEEALEIISEARALGHRCMFRSGLCGDSYTYIRRWCNKGSFSKIWEWIKARFVRTDVSENKRRMLNVNKTTQRPKRQPWYKRLSAWVYVVGFLLILTSIVCYFYELHLRTLYDVPWWIWLVGCAFFAVVVFFKVIRYGISGMKEVTLEGSIFLSVCLGAIMGFIGTLVGIGLFDGVNSLFADRTPVIAEAIVTDVRYYYEVRTHRRGPIKHYVAIVELPEEKRTMRIEDYYFYKMFTGDEILITYRKGLFGVDIYEGFEVK